MSGRRVHTSAGYKVFCGATKNNHTAGFPAHVFEWPVASYFYANLAGEYTVGLWSELSSTQLSRVQQKEEPM